MKLKSAITLFFICSLGYIGFGFVKVHTSADVIAYKSFSKALMKGDLIRAKRMVLSDDVLAALDSSKDRASRYKGTIRFTYHQVLNHDYTGNGEEARLKVKQIIRMDPANGESTLWGSQTLEEVHTVVLRKNEDGHWKIIFFDEALI